MPLGLYRHLEGKYPKLRFELIQGTASELFFSVEGEAQNGPALTIGSVKGKLKNPLKKKVNNARNTLKGQGISNAVLREKADEIVRALGRDASETDRTTGMILAGLGDVSGSPISDAEADDIENEIRAFLRAERGGSPFDLLRFGVARCRPDPRDTSSASTDRIVAALETALGRKRAGLSRLGQRRAPLHGRPRRQAQARGL